MTKVLLFVWFVICATSALAANDDSPSYICECCAGEYPAAFEELTSCNASALVDLVDLFVVDSTTAAYEVASEQYATWTYPEETQPGIIVYPQSEEGVQAALIFARKCGYSVSARGGGHSYLGLSTCGDDLCMVLDASNMTHAEVSGDNLVTVGPGHTLQEMSAWLEEQGQFVAYGECAQVGIGGHMQTGGYGVYARAFQLFTLQIESFRIVLADASIYEVEQPSAETTNLNDDLFYAVLGGASGSWGIVTQATIRTHRDSDYFNVFWKVHIVWDNSQQAMEHFFTEIMQKMDLHHNDTRWGMMITPVGVAPLGLPNYVQFEASWTAPMEQADDYDYRFFQDMIDACTECTILEFANDTEPMATSWKNKIVSVPNGHEFPHPWVHYTKNWMQGSSYPDPIALVELIDQYMPVANDTFLYFAQVNAFLSGDPQRSLPWQDDFFGITCSFHYPALEMKPAFDAIMANITNTLVELFDGQDHRMFWAAHPDTVDLALDWPFYYESAQKFERLQHIKACVDPNALFRNKMTMPLPDTLVDVEEGEDLPEHQDDSTGKDELDGEVTLEDEPVEVEKSDQTKEEKSTEEQGQEPIMDGQQSAASFNSLASSLLVTALSFFFGSLVVPKKLF